MKKFILVSLLAFVALLRDSQANESAEYGDIVASECLIYLNYDIVDSDSAPFARTFLPNKGFLDLKVWNTSLSLNNENQQVDAIINKKKSSGSIREAKFLSTQYDSFGHREFEGKMIVRCQDPSSYGYLLKNATKGRFLRLDVYTDPMGLGDQLLVPKDMEANEICYVGNVQKAQLALFKDKVYFRAVVIGETLQVPYEY